MSPSQQSQTTTRMFARVLGPFLIIVDVMAVVRTGDMRSVVAEFAASSLWSWVAGAFVLLFGLVIIALHQYWRGTAAIIVSLLGWLVGLRGLLLLAFPKTFVSVANSMLDAKAWWVTICIALALVGVYLTYVGWAPAPGRPTSEAAGSPPGLPRAA
ncbi:MAG: hypothetical protein QJR12_07305 [Mycobacterium sp.]|uniref:hypothetical protein n=1 Tax=Mycobacterium sp. TaxID=1785 RepID=UPI00260BA9C4|nr:hypothetical protein [Mycobacterium sp.]MDI3314080.1 hypothetical protein [Mycobacterium sp.]